MRTSREFYLRHDFAYYDCGMLAVMPPVLFLLYDLLRRYVWRSLEAADPEVRRLVRGGHLVARINQNTLAEMLGYDRRETVCRHLQRLVRLGWVRVQPSEQHGVASYILGEVVEDSSGGRHEVFYADAFLQHLVEHLDTLAAETLGPGATLRDLPLPLRVQTTSAYINSRESTSVEPMTEIAQGLCEKTHEGCAKEITLEIERNFVPLKKPKNENDTELPGGSAPRTPPAIRERPRGNGKGTSGNPESVPERVSESSPSSEVSSRGVDLSELKARFQRAQRATATETLREEKNHATRVDNLQNGKRRSVMEARALTELESLWLRRLRERFPGTPFATWGARERKTIGDLVARYGDPTDPSIGRGVVESMFEYVIDRWEEVNTAMLKGQAAAPTIAFLGGFHERLATEAGRAALRARVEREVDTWYAENPHRPLPEELSKRWEKVR